MEEEVVGSTELTRVRLEVGTLSEQVTALQTVVCGGSKVEEKDIVFVTEMLMRQLLKLDGIEAEGEAKQQRKMEVLTVQRLVETMDNLKAMNANLVSNSSTVLPVLARHDTSESGVGDLNPQPSTPEGSLGEVQNPSQVVQDGQSAGDAEMVTVVEIVEDSEGGTNDGSGWSEMVAQDGQHPATGGSSGSLGQPSLRSQATGAHGLSVPASNRVIGEEPSPANDPRFARWREYEVYAKYVDLLESIGAHHPETFHGLVAASSIMQGMSLNVLAATVNGFVSIPFSRLTEHHIEEYRRVFLDLEHMGFNINWMRNRLDNAEAIRFSGPLYDEYVATAWRITEIHKEMTRLQDELCPLEARQLDLLDKLETSFGAVGVSLALGALGEGLL